MPFTLALGAGLLLSGCYLLHGFGEAGLDAGTRRMPGPDAGALPDAGTLPSCPPIGIDFACTDTETGFIPVGVPYELPIVVGYFDRCFCGEAPHCIATIEAPGRLAIRTAMCDELDCDGCFPYHAGTCLLPPLSEGSWRVSVNGVDAMDLQVSDATPIVGPVDRCMTTAGEGPFCPAEWSPQDQRVGQACIPVEARPGAPIAVDVTDFCAPCGSAQGSCDTLRTANEIVVRPRVLPPECDIECPPSCDQRDSHCFIPPLEPGEYDVRVEGLPGVATITVSESAPRGGVRSCLSVPED